MKIRDLFENTDRYVRRYVINSLMMAREKDIKEIPAFTIINEIKADLGIIIDENIISEVIGFYPVFRIENGKILIEPEDEEFSDDLEDDDIVSDMAAKQAANAMKEN